MSATTTAGQVTGTCTGGCGRQLTRQAVPGDGWLARKANAVPFICDECAQRAERQMQAAERAQADRQAGIDRRQRETASGLPAELRRVELDELDTAGCFSAIDTARGWAARELHGLLLTGPFGTGKTTIAAGAFRILLRDHPGRWVSAPTLLARLGAGFGDQQREWALDLLTARHALAVDDLDKTRPTEYGAEQIFLAVDNAVTRGQQLLVTTNLSLGELARKWPAPYGEAIASRLVGYCTTITVAGRDRRLGGGRAC